MATENISESGSDTAPEGSQPPAEADKAEVRIIMFLDGFKQFMRDWNYTVPAQMPEHVQIQCYATKRRLTLETAFVFRMPDARGGTESQILCRSAADIMEKLALEAAKKHGDEGGKVQKAQTLVEAMKKYFAAHKKFADERRQHEDMLRALPIKDIQPHWRNATEIVRFGAPECVPLVTGELDPVEVAEFRKEYGRFADELDTIFETQKPRRFEDIGRMVDDFVDDWEERGNRFPFLSAALMKRDFGQKQGCRYLCVASRDVSFVAKCITEMDRVVEATKSVVLYFLVLRYALRAEALREQEQCERDRVRFETSVEDVGADTVTAMAQAFGLAGIEAVGGEPIVEKNPGRGRGRKVATGGEFGGGDDAPRRGRKPRK